MTRYRCPGCRDPECMACDADEAPADCEDFDPPEPSAADMDAAAWEGLARYEAQIDARASQ